MHLKFIYNSATLRKLLIDIKLNQLWKSVWYLLQNGISKLHLFIKIELYLWNRFEKDSRFDWSKVKFLVRNFFENYEELSNFFLE